MRQLFGLFLGALIGLWAGPIGFVFPVVAFVKGLPYRWGALLGYGIGLVGAMLLYRSLDSVVFGDPEPLVESLVEARMRAVEEAPSSVREAEEPSEMPLWLIAIIPGAMIATLGVAGAGWILATSDDDGELSDRH